jgi:hypothetical protein
MRLQEIRIHGNTPLNNAFNFARPIRLIYGFRKGLVELWIKETATVLMFVGLGSLRHRTPRQSSAMPTPKRIFCTTSDGRRGAAKPVRAQAGR